MLTIARNPRVFFICGSLNQTTQMHQIAAQMPDSAASFSPYYGDAFLTKLRALGLVEPTIGGNKLRQRCLDYLTAQGLDIDMDGQRGGYDLVVTCSDVIVPRNVTSNLPELSAEPINETVPMPKKSALAWKAILRTPVPAV